MKKIFVFTALLFAILSFSCCEKDPTTTPQTINDFVTANDFNGNWEFVNFYYPGDGNYSSCPCKYGNVLMSLNINNGKCTITDKCGGVIADNYNITYTPGPKQLTVQKDIINTYIFYVVSYNNGTMVLRRDIATGVGQYVKTELTVKKK